MTDPQRPLTLASVVTRNPDAYVLVDCRGDVWTLDSEGAWRAADVGRMIEAAKVLVRKARPS